MLDKCSSRCVSNWWKESSYCSDEFSVRNRIERIDSWEKQTNGVLNVVSQQVGRNG